MPRRHPRNQQDHTHGRLKGIKMKTQLKDGVERRPWRCPACIGSPRKLFPQNLTHHAAVAMIQGVPVTAHAGGRPWCHPHGTVSIGMLCWSGNRGLHPDFSGRPGQESLKAAPKRVMHEAVRVKVRTVVETPGIKRCQACGMFAKESCRKQEEQGQEREATWAATSKATGTGQPKPFGADILPPYDPDPEHRSTGPNVCQGGLHFCFGPFPSF